MPMTSVRRFTGIALATILVAGAAVGVSQASLFQDPQNVDGPGVSQAPATPQKKPTSLLLTVRVDARGVEIVLVTRKPELEFSRVKIWDRQPFGWIMRDSNGQQIAEGGFDPGRMDLDRANYGKPGRVEGDWLIATSTHTNVQVPDLADFTSIEFLQKGSNVAAVPFGAARAASLPYR